ncbi:zinc/iron-chelating domain-containing protein [Rubrivivax gelatinosus]|uniref:YkgJ family cysteine cluster protein n=1 Tax=Rubrivivax gelatinosus TaxID=28068 RepID=UPI0019071344|nr:YkgJ family cysteine cluster protein [Rubrivivax gelatinosus]MBK1616267.1 zinc/iron-chelating domain-containing protein [Rubrivivax gelatinosus]
MTVDTDTAAAADLPAGDDLDFYRALHRAFDSTLAQGRGTTTGIERLMAQALDTFDGNLSLRCADEPPPACRKACATCCQLRVVASTPEVLLAAHFLARVAPPLADRGIDLVGALRAAEARTHRRSEAERAAAPVRCPFLAQGVCVIYPVRPLACRGHASSDARACAEAAAGRRAEVPVSSGHRQVRALVQNALQSALREAGLAWELYEFNEALVTALDHPGPAAAWWAGEDPLAGARCDEVAVAEQQAVFDRLRPPA